VKITGQIGSFSKRSRNITPTCRASLSQKKITLQDVLTVNGDGNHISAIGQALNVGLAVKR